MGRFDRYTDDELEDDDFIAALLGAQEEGDVSPVTPPRAPGPYDHMSDEQLSDPDVLAGLLGDQEQGDTTATMQRPPSPYSVELGDAQIHPSMEVGPVSMRQPAPPVPQAPPGQPVPQGPQGPSGAPAPMSRKAGDMLAKQQEQSFQRNAKGGWDSSQYGDVESIAADGATAKLNHNSAPFKDEGSAPGARIDAITGQPLEGGDDLDVLLDQEQPRGPQLDATWANVDQNGMPRDAVPQEPEGPDELDELAGPAAPQAPQEPYSDPGQDAYDARRRRAQEAGDQFDRQSHEQPQEDYERYAHEAQSGYRQTDDDLQRMWAINTIFGKEGDNFKAVAMGRQMQDAYDQRVQHGQQLDSQYAGRRQPAPTRADAELLALNWDLSPQGAAGGRVNPDLVKGIGPTASRRDLQTSEGAVSAADNERMRLNKAADERIHAGDSRSREKVGAAHDETDRYRADKNLEGVKLQHNPADQADPADLAATLIQQKTGASRSDALGWAHGTASYDHLPEGTKRKIETSIASAPTIAKNPKHTSSLLSGLERSDASIPDRHEQASGDPKALLETRNKLKAETGPFVPAYQGIAALKKVGKLRLLGQLGQQGAAGMVRNGLMTGEEAAAGGAALQFVGQYAHGQYGANFTEGERQQLAKISGIRFGGGFDPTAHPEVITRFFQGMKKILGDREQATFQLYPQLRGMP